MKGLGKVFFCFGALFFANNANADSYAKIGGAYGFGYQPSRSAKALDAAGLDVHAGVNKERIDLEFNYLYLQGFRHNNSVERRDSVGSYIANEKTDSNLQAYLGSINFRLLTGKFQPYVTFGAGVMMVQTTTEITEIGRVARYSTSSNSMRDCTKAGGGFLWKFNENFSLYGESVLWSGPVRFFTGQFGLVMKP